MKLFKLFLFALALSFVAPQVVDAMHIGNRNSTTSSDISTGYMLLFNVKGVEFKMVPVQGGSFIMGATPEQGVDAFDNEKPSHRVTLSDFFIGQTEVTQELWTVVMGYNPSENKGHNYPVENVTWNQCQQFIQKLNSITGKKFSLPTEAQWEYAARGGKKSKGYKYSGSNDIKLVAWYSDNSSTSMPVALKNPNELGIFDMSGNVDEWCSDYFGEYKVESQINPQGPATGTDRVLRCGAWYNFINWCRVSTRYPHAQDYSDNGLGLRLVLVP